MGTVVAYNNELTERFIKRAERGAEWVKRETRNRRYHVKRTKKNKLRKAAAVKLQKKLSRKDNAFVGRKGRAGK